MNFFNDDESDLAEMVELRIKMYRQLALRFVSDETRFVVAKANLKGGSCRSHILYVTL